MEEKPTLTSLFPLPPEAQKLQVFVGDWRVEGTLTVEGESKKVNGVWNFESAAAGWGVLGRMKMEIEEMGSYEEVDIVGFDPGEGIVHVFTVTNTAATHDHEGSWTDDNTLNLVYEGLQEEKNYQEQITIKFRSAKEFSIHEVDTVDGNVTMTMDVTLRR